MYESRKTCICIGCWNAVIDSALPRIAADSTNESSTDGDGNNPMIFEAREFEHEACIARLYDSEKGDWTNAYVYQVTNMQEPKFRIRLAPSFKLMLEMGGKDFGPTLLTIIQHWEERYAQAI